jgi:hypothetical protein
MALARYDHVAALSRAAALRQVPVPDREFGEDLAWGAAILGAGLRLAYVPMACVEHHHPPTWRELFHRNRLAHRQARAEFGLHAVSGPGDGLLAWVRGLPGDWRDGGLPGLWHGMPRRAAELMGQWAGARDAGR